MTRDMPARGARPRRRAAPRRGRGMGLIELLIAMALMMLLIAGMLSVLAGTRQTSLSQGQMAQLQDDQRLALAMLTNVVQQAGYFPSPTTSTSAIELPSNATFASAGQAIVGTDGGASGDTLVVRYEAGTADGTMDCNGGVNAGLVLTNTFSVDANGNLNCAVAQGAAAAAAAQTLAGNVQNFQVLYGVDLLGDRSSLEYLPASAMTAANWASVISVRVSLTFQNPLAALPGQPATLPPVTQVIPLYNHS